MSHELHTGHDNTGHVILCDGWKKVAVSRYAVGEEIAIAQPYRDLIRQGYLCRDSDGWVREKFCTSPGYHNKMFVATEYMPHRIKITDIKLERLQDISEDDIYEEGFEKISVNNGWGNAAWHWEVKLTYMDNLGLYKEIRSTTPQQAYAYLIDKLLGNGTWESNPLVWAYTFDLVV